MYSRVNKFLSGLVAFLFMVLVFVPSPVLAYGAEKVASEATVRAMMSEAMSKMLQQYTWSNIEILSVYTENGLEHDFDIIVRVEARNDSTTQASSANHAPTEAVLTPAKPATASGNVNGSTTSKERTWIEEVTFLGAEDSDESLFDNLRVEIYYTDLDDNRVEYFTPEQRYVVHLHFTQMNSCDIEQLYAAVACTGFSLIYPGEEFFDDPDLHEVVPLVLTAESGDQREIRLYNAHMCPPKHTDILWMNYEKKTMGDLQIMGMATAEALKDRFASDKANKGMLIEFDEDGVCELTFRVNTINPNKHPRSSSTRDTDSSTQITNLAPRLCLYDTIRIIVKIFTKIV